jgi:hypothetical protein
MIGDRAPLYELTAFGVLTTANCVPTGRCQRDGLVRRFACGNDYEVMTTDLDMPLEVVRGIPGQRFGAAVDHTG